MDCAERLNEKELVFRTLMVRWSNLVGIVEHCHGTHSVLSQATISSGPECLPRFNRTSLDHHTCSPKLTSFFGVCGPVHAHLDRHVSLSNVLEFTTDCVVENRNRGANDNRKTRRDRYQRKPTKTERRYTS